MTDAGYQLIGDNGQDYGTQSPNVIYGRAVKNGPNIICKRTRMMAATVLVAMVVAAVVITLRVGGSKEEPVFSSPPEGPLTLTVGSKTTPILEIPKSVSESENFTRAAVAANSEVCAQIARDILGRNGSAVDAAVAGVLCLGVVHPHHSGIGGGLVMTVYDRVHKEAVVIDARETAPFGLAAANMSRQPLFGGLSVGVPGEIHGLWTAHQLYGKLPWSQLVSPSVDLCFGGFRIDETLSDALLIETGRIKKEPSLRDVFVNATSGLMYKLNDTITNPILGNTLNSIAINGITEFYEGATAILLARDVFLYGGFLSLFDLANYTSVKRAPVVSITGPLRVLGAPPPGNGASLALILNILSGFNWTAVPQTSPLAYHRFAEAFKFAAPFLPLFADPDFEDVAELVANLTCKTFADALRARISDLGVLPAEEYGVLGLELPVSHGTSHISIVDQDGNAVSVSATLNDRFGAKIRSRSTGIFLNNQMADFSLSGPNRLVGGKRPASRLTPTVILDDKTSTVRLVTGASGGNRITTATAFVTAENLLLGASLLNATDSPRLHHQLKPNVLQVEEGLPMETLLALKQLGHQVAEIRFAVGPSSVNSVGRVGSSKKKFHLEAVADRRAHGAVAGL